MTHPDTDQALPADERKGRHFWQEQFERWQSSGLSKAAWCRQGLLNVTAFYYWCRIFERDHEIGVNPQSPGTVPPVSPFLPVAVQSPPTTGFQLQVADVTLTCSQPISSVQLREWVQAIRSSL